MYVKTTSGNVDTYPYNVGKLRRDNPNTSFPKRIPDEMLADWGVYPVVFEIAPEIDDRTQKIAKQLNPTLVSGVWNVGWEITSKTLDEVQEWGNKAADGVRTKRDQLIAETDWMALSDNTLTPAWATYRQALRDITDHVNFPYLADEDWPVKPD